MMGRYMCAIATLTSLLLLLGYLGIHQHATDENVVQMRRRLDDYPESAENPGMDPASMFMQKEDVVPRNLNRQESKLYELEPAEARGEVIRDSTPKAPLQEHQHVQEHNDVDQEEINDTGEENVGPRIFYLDDGTLLVHQMPETAACSYFATLPNLPMRVPEPPKRLHYHIEDCSDDHLGIELAEYFGHYLLANAAQVPYTMTCGNADTAGNSVLALMQTDNEFPGPPPVDITGFTYNAYDVCFTCYGLSSWCERGPDLMVDTFQQDMWKLVNTEFGQSVQPEDAVVHLRLGDALESGRDEGIGLLPFRSYSRLLRRAENDMGPLETISVVTQTFDEAASRPQDKKSLARSEMVTKDFLDHLRENFPHAKVTLHNSPADTPFVTYIRLIKARKTAICGATTFCTYPVLANPGISYVFETEKLNPWVKRLGFMDAVRTYDTPRLASNYAGSLTDNQLMHWLRHQDPNGNDVITSPPLFRVPKTKFAYT